MAVNEQELDVISLLIILKKRMIHIILITVVITAFFYGFAKFVSYRYTEKALIALPAYTTSNYKGILNNSSYINNLIEEFNYKLLYENDEAFMTKFGVDAEIVRHVIGVHYDYNPQNAVSSTVRFDIKATRPGCGQDVAEWLVAFLNSRESFLSEREQYVKMFKEKEQRLQKVVDSVKSKDEAVAKIIESSQIFNLMFNPVDIDEKMLRLLNEYSDIQRINMGEFKYELQAKVVAAFVPDKPVRLMLTAAGFVIGVFFSIVSVVILELVSIRDESSAV